MIPYHLYRIYRDFFEHLPLLERIESKLFIAELDQIQDQFSVNYIIWSTLIPVYMEILKHNGYEDD